MTHCEKKRSSNVEAAIAVAAVAFLAMIAGAWFVGYAVGKATANVDKKIDIELHVVGELPVTGSIPITGEIPINVKGIFDPPPQPEILPPQILPALPMKPDANTKPKYKTTTTLCR